MSEMDEEEAFLPVIQLTNFVIVSTVIGLVLITAVIALFVRISITRRLSEMLEAVFDLRAGDGNLTLRLPDFGDDEIGQTAKNLNGNIERLQNLMRKLKEEMAQLADASLNVHAKATTFRENSATQAVAIEQTSSALTEMAVSINQNAENDQ